MLNLYLWKNVRMMPVRYNGDGGLVIIAQTLDAARELIREDEDYPDSCEALTMEPDFICKTDVTEKMFFDFPVFNIPGY